MLGEVFDAIGRGYKVVEVEQGDVAAPPADIHACDLETGLIHEDSVRLSDMPGVRRKEGPNEQDTAGKQMARHRRNRLLQPRGRRGIRDGAEQASDYIKLPTEIEVHHVALVKDDARMALTGQREHLRIEIQPFIDDIVAQIGNVPARAAGDIEHAIAG